MVMGTAAGSDQERRRQVSLGRARRRQSSARGLGAAEAGAGGADLVRAGGVASPGQGTRWRSSGGQRCELSSKRARAELMVQWPARGPSGGCSGRRGVVADEWQPEGGENGGAGAAEWRSRTGGDVGAQAASSRVQRRQQAAKGSGRDGGRALRVLVLSDGKGGAATAASTGFGELLVLRSAAAGSVGASVLRAERQQRGSSSSGRQGISEPARCRRWTDPARVRFR